MSDITTPVKPISEIEEKAEVSENDKILILDSETDEARLASKEELKGDKWDQWDPWTPWADGKDGKDGKDWADWAAATVTVGTTSTWAAWTSASVTNSGTSSAAVLNFTIPKWDKWDTWSPWADWKDWTDGQDGQDGADWNWITSVTSSKVWKTTTVTMNFDEWDPFSFQVQDWADWQWAWDVLWPNSSTDGNVVLFDWVTWKLIKDSGKTIPTNVSDLQNDSWFITGIDSSDVTTALGYTPADSASLWTAATKNTWTSSWNVPVLDANWKLNTTILPALAITDTFTVSTTSDLVWLTSAEKWDVAIVTTDSETYILSADPYSTASNWKKLATPTDTVTSVNSKTWAVTLDADDISDSTTTNKFVTATDKSTWSGKQDALTLPATPTQWNLVVRWANNKTIADWWAIPTWVPSGWNNGDVLTNVSWTPTWQAISWWHDYSWNTLTWTTLSITGSNYRNQISTSSNLTVSAGTGLTPWMEYILRVVNSDSSNAITMTWDSVAYTIPAGWEINFKFISLTATTLDFDWPRIVATTPSTFDSGKIYFEI